MERINASKQVDIIPLYENSVETETVEDDNYVTDDNGTQSWLIFRILFHQLIINQIVLINILQLSPTE